VANTREGVAGGAVLRAGTLSEEATTSDSSQSVPELWPSEHVAALLHIGERALRDYDRRGWLTPVRIGRRKLYLANEILKLLANGTPNNPHKNKA
jgi:hypothetical protein